MQLILKVHSDILQQDLRLNPFERLITDIVNAMNPYQIVLFVNETIGQVIPETEYIKQFLVRDFPTVIMDFEHNKKLTDIMKYPIIGSPRFSTLFILLYVNVYQNNSPIYSEVVSILDCYVEMFPRPIRPRWLTVMINNRTEDNSNIELLLHEAWKKRFLDFTIMEITYGKLDFDQIVLHYYNPFKKVTETKIYTESIDLFPDKLHDMNGYGLPTIFVHDPPTVYLERNSSGHIVSINGSDYWNIRTLSKVLNFSILINATFAEDYTQSYNQTSAFDAVYNGELAFAGNQLYIWTILHTDKYLERSRLLKPEGYCALVPNRFIRSDDSASRFYRGLFLTLLLVTFLVRLSKFMKFNKRIWTHIHLFQAIIGFSLTKHPQRLVERILFGSVIVTSVSYTTIYYAIITNRSIHVVYEIPLKSYKDLDKSGLIPLVFEPFYDITFGTFDDGSKYMKSLKRKARFFKSMSRCPEEMTRNRSIACILPENMGQVMEEKYLSDDGTSTMRVMKPCFWIAWKGFAFSQGSPYREKFDLVFERIVQSGLSVRWAEASKPRIKGSKKDTNLDNDETRQRIAFLLSTGYSFSFLVFLIELATHYVNAKI